MKLNDHNPDACNHTVQESGLETGTGHDAEHVPNTPHPAKEEVDVPPDGGYGWICVACVFWINAHTWGINSVIDHQ